jgi:hypothetical protein
MSDEDTQDDVEDSQEPEHMSLDDAVESAFEEHADSVSDRDLGDETQSSVDKPTREAPQDSSTEPQEADAIPAPNSWARESKELWQAIPRQVQEQIFQRELDRERVFTQRTQEAADLKRRYQQLDDLFAPYQEEMLSKGLNPSQLVGQYMMFEKAFSENPAEVIKNLMAAKGLTFDSLTDDQSQINPEIQGLKQQVGTLTQYLEQQYQAADQQAHEARAYEAYEFAQETDQNGNLLRPYFEQASEMILLHAQQLAQRYPQATNRQILESAYDMAIHADPNTRSAVMDAYARQQAAKQIEDARKQAQKARRASSPLRGSPSGGVMNGSRAMTLEEAVEAAYDKHIGA